MNFIYQNEATLDKKNNSTIDISEKKKNFVSGNEYLLSSLELKLKKEDIAKWEDYEKNLGLSNLIIDIKKKTFFKHKFKRLYNFIK